MKFITTILCCFLFVSITNSQGKYLTKSGHITFFSSSSMEDIKAENNQVLSIIDASNGKMAISILMKSFMFEKALMQEHFNENYVESDTYPKATFKGEILNFDSLNETNNKAKIKGEITIHGVTKEITIDVNIKRTKEAIDVDGDFIITLSDFKVSIPSIVEKNISKTLKISFNFNHKQYNK